MTEVNVFMRHARANEVMSVEKQVKVANVIRVSMRCNDVINLLGFDMMILQRVQKHVAIPRSQRVKLKNIVNNSVNLDLKSNISSY